MNERPTSAQRADAVDRLMAKLDQALAMIAEANAVLREGSPHHLPTLCPLFTFVDRDIAAPLDIARDAIWKAQGAAAKYGYEHHRKAGNLPQPAAVSLPVEEQQ